MLALTPYATAAAGLAALTLRRRARWLRPHWPGRPWLESWCPARSRAASPRPPGPVLRVLTVNLLSGQAAGDELVGLTRRTDADVLFLQELTEDAVTRLKRAGLSDLLPYEMLGIEGYRYRGSGIYARHPLSDGLTIGPSYASQPTARLDLPSGQSVHLVCVHPHPPAPPWYWPAAPALAPGAGRAAWPEPDPCRARRGLQRHPRSCAVPPSAAHGARDAASQVGRGLVPPGRRRQRRARLCCLSTMCSSTLAAPCWPPRRTHSPAATTALCTPSSGCLAEVIRGHCAARPAGSQSPRHRTETRYRPADR